jgi:GT2 family glycosyltransferase
MDDRPIRPPVGDAKCRREDIVNLYNLFLRRDPESESAITPRLEVAVADLFYQLAGSREFSSIVHRLAENNKNTALVAYKGSTQLRDLVEWAAQRLPISAETLDLLDEANAWDDVTLAVLRDPAVIDGVADLREPAIRRSIEQIWFTRESRVKFDTLFVSPEGHCFFSGWVNSAGTVPIRELAFYRGAAPLGKTPSVARCRRAEAEEAFPESAPNLPGFWAVAALNRPIDAGKKLEVSVTTDKEARCPITAVAVTDQKLRDIALEHLADAQYYGDPTAEAFFQLDDGLGQALIDLNCSVVARIVDGGYRMQFGTRRASYDGTIVVCLYGKPEYLMLQAALFSQCPGYDRYEFIYVSNSPELGETLASDAAIASRIYGVAITLIILPGNAGFGAANNVAAAAAATDRLLFVNPDVLPRDPEWPRRHAEMVRNLPPEQVKLFGTTLYYDDGSLMHGGMYIDVDSALSMRDGKMVRREILRVEHFGKGAPAEADAYRISRPVPAVSGAFLSIDRAWFEKLDGFSRQYIFGHSEDSDLCLRSLQAGVPAWLHDLPFWHLESKGATYGRAQIGGRLVNRWLLTSTWGEFVKAELNGRNPVRFAK